MTVSTYQNGLEILFKNPWPSSIYGAQLVDFDYNYDVSNSTRANLAGNLVGSPIELSGKSVDGGVISADNLDYSSQGTLLAGAVIVHLMSSGQPLDTDEIVFHCLLSDVENLEVADTSSIDLGNLTSITEVV